MHSVTDPDEYLRQAYAALLRGDLAERDRLCALALKASEETERLIKLSPGDPLAVN